MYLNFSFSLIKTKHTIATMLKKKAIINIAGYPSIGFKIWTINTLHIPAKATADYIILYTSGPLFIPKILRTKTGVIAIIAPSTAKIVTIEIKYAYWLCTA